MVSRGFQRKSAAGLLSVGRGVSPPGGNFDNFMFKMVQSGAFWRSCLC